MVDLSRFRDPTLARNLLAEIHRLATRPWAIMEVCGGQTNAIVRQGLDQLLPPGIELIHGPGCPVCVAPASLIAGACALTSNPQIILATFGDMLRVPGTSLALQQAKASGGDVRVVYSPLEALDLALKHPTRQVVFLAIGFETTAPAYASLALHAHRLQLSNLSLLTSIVRVPPALEALLADPDNRVQGVLAAGHVCGIMGYHEYPPIADKFKIPIIVTGFEPLDILEGIRRVIAQLEHGEHTVENAYPRVVTLAGNTIAQASLAEVFEPADQEWRGIGVIPASGWKLRDTFRHLDAAQKFSATLPTPVPCTQCRSGEVLRGKIKPLECPAFGNQCTPRTPLGPTMISAEGACAAYFHAGRLSAPNQSTANHYAPDAHATSV